MNKSTQADILSNLTFRHFQDKCPKQQPFGVSVLKNCMPMRFLRPDPFLAYA